MPDTAAPGSVTLPRAGEAVGVITREGSDPHDAVADLAASIKTTAGRQVRPPAARKLTLLQRWIRQPQTVWLRKALFQVHLWTGLGIGLYILVVSITGSAVVFRVELSRSFSSTQQFAYLTWLIDLHDNLLGGSAGRTINGLGGLVLTLLVISGAVIWWPGTRGWRRSLMIQRNVSWRRFNWNLHSVMGFWTFAFLFMWAITGAYLVFQQQISPVVDAIFPYNDNFDLRPIDTFLIWFTRVHFGRFGGLWMKVTWAVLGLVPPVLFITGAVMWWQRVLNKKLQ